MNNLFICSSCNETIGKNNNIFKAHDLSFCSPDCRNYYCNDYNYFYKNNKNNFIKTINTKSYKSDLNTIILEEAIILEEKFINKSIDDSTACYIKINLKESPKDTPKDTICNTIIYYIVLSNINLKICNLICTLLSKIIIKIY